MNDPPIMQTLKKLSVDWNVSWDERGKVVREQARNQKTCI